MRPLQAFLFWFLFLFEKREQKVHEGEDGQGEGRGGSNRVSVTFLERLMQSKLRHNDSHVLPVPGLSRRDPPLKWGGDSSLKHI